MNSSQNVILAIAPGKRELGIAVFAGVDLVYVSVKTIRHRKSNNSLIKEVTGILQKLFKGFSVKIVVCKAISPYQKLSPDIERIVERIEFELQLPEDLKPEQRQFLEQFINLCPEALKIQVPGQKFRAIIRERLETNFDDWMKAGEESGIKELENFVKGIKQDRAAVKSAVKFEWSQGQVEGQVNRLKMLKRQMYGRAKFDLLRARVLHRI